MNKMIKLCKRTTYYSQTDETMFFEWINRIPSIIDVKGIGDELHLFVSEDLLNEQQLVEILALFYRYKDDMKQFQQFLNKENKDWFFDNKKAYWHRRVFGLNNKSKSKVKSEKK